MTREEAANVLRSTWLNAGRVNGKTVFAEALNMAIKALETQPDGDTVSRRAALDEIDSFLAVDKYYHPYSQGKTIPVEEMRERLKQLPSAQPESTRTFVELVVEYPDPELCTYKKYRGKPYYSIKYIENDETYVGYGTYNPEVLSQYLKEYFISSAQPNLQPACNQLATDTISRQAAIDEIEYELEMINSALDSITLDFNTRERLRQRRGEAREILNSIQQLPSAQPDLCDGCDRYGASCVGEGCGKLEMPEIIRCKDCKHRDPEDKKCDCGHDIVWNLPRQDDWFCADAERRTDGVDC